MEAAKRPSVHLHPELHRALKAKAAATARSISELVNEAVEVSLAEDFEDLATFEQRRDEPTFSFEDVVLDLKCRGRL